MSKLADAIKIVLAEEGKPVGRTKLVKLLFLADLEATRQGLEPVTTGHWVYDKFGPFDWSVVDEAQRLAAGGEVRRAVTRTGADLFSAAAGAASVGELTDRQAEILRETVGRWRGQSANVVKRHVYGLPVIRCNEPGEEYDMAAPDWRQQLWFYDTLERLVEEDQEIVAELMAAHGD